MIDKRYTVLIPHHNTPDLLARCLDSIPDREDIAVVVVDDNSDEQYAAAITSSCATHKNVVCIMTHEGLGAGYARNIGLEHADSRWILFADADDYFMPNAFDILDRHYEDDADLIYFHSISRYSDTGQPGMRHEQVERIMDNYMANPNPRTEDALRFGYNEPWGKMIRTELIRTHAIRFEQIRWANDVQFSTRVGAYARRIEAYADEVYCVTIAHGSLVHQHTLESRRCRYEAILRKNQFLREIGKAQCQDSLMYSLRWAAKLGGLKAVVEFIRIGRTYGAEFTRGADQWIRNFFISLGEYKNREKYIIKDK